MFGGYVAKGDCESELGIESEAAFRVLVDALIELQQAGRVRHDDPHALAVFVWASVHGTAMLAIGGQLGRPDAPMDALATFTVDRVWDAVAAPVPAPVPPPRR